MPASSPDPKSTSSGVARRTIHACANCRRHKIRCSGQTPCATCSRRGLQCIAGHRQRYRKEYVQDLEQRLAAKVQSTSDDLASHDSSTHAAVTVDGSASPHHTASNANASAAMHAKTSSGAETTEEDTQVNPLAIGEPMYLADSRGRSVYLGTSSNWSFGRRVLLLVQTEGSATQAGAPQQLMFPGKVYDLGWTGERDRIPIHDTSLLQAEHAMFLINAVKFRVGQLFHIFDEASFMGRFEEFHKDPTSERLLDSMWYKHYLLVLAFGKAILAQTVGDRPPGYDLFLVAMAAMPELSFWYPMHSDPLEEMEILCCVALYLHSIDCRGAAYRKIGDALRLALDQGLHTDMQSNHASGYVLQRARKIWWTIHLLDRQMSSLQGLPLATRDEDITAPLPSFEGSPERAAALKVHIQLARAMATIVNNIYGREGRMQSHFLTHTRTALNVIADVKDELQGTYLLISLDGQGSGISRASAYLHLLQHECIIMATRPILFNLMESRVASEKLPPPPHCIIALMHTCRDSALQILLILDALRTQGLLECFLPFDLDALYTSAVVVLMAANVRETLLETAQPWISIAYTLLDDVAGHGNRIAGHLKVELEQISIQMSYLPHHNADGSAETTLAKTGISEERRGDRTEADKGAGSLQAHEDESQSDGLHDFPMWDNNLDGERMAMLADAVDLNALEWWFDSRNSTTWLP